MKKLLAAFLTVGLFGKIIAQPNWNTIKVSQAPTNALPAEYGTPIPLNMSNTGWEDGQYMTRDGLTVYSFYAPLDLLAMNFLAPPAGPDQCTVSPYMRGPSLGVTFDSVPPLLYGICTEWLQSDIVWSHRNSIADTFPDLSKTNIAYPHTFDGAPQLILNDTNPNIVDYFVWTTLQPDSTVNLNTTGEIYWIKNTGLNPSGVPVALPAPINTDSTSEDNPHLERISDSELVLFFRSEDRPGSLSAEDIWVSESSDTGNTWSIPVLVNFSSATFEDMPHAFKDSAGIYWLYHMDENQSIVRRQQSTPGDWVNWGTPTTVITPGTGHAVGEPSLTQWGDICFGFVFDAGTGHGTDSTDRFDDDFWILPRNGSPLIAGLVQNEIATKVYPNPTEGSSIISFSQPVNEVQCILSSATGQILSDEKFTSVQAVETQIDGPSGIYALTLIYGSGRTEVIRLVKE